MVLAEKNFVIRDEFKKGTIYTGEETTNDSAAPQD